MSNEERGDGFHSSGSSSKRGNVFLYQVKTDSCGSMWFPRWKPWHLPNVVSLWMTSDIQGIIRTNDAMQSEIHEGNAMKYSLFTHWLVMCLVSIFFSTTGFAEPTDGTNQREVDEEENVQQRAREKYAGIWRIETIASKGNTSEPDKRIIINNKVDGTWTLFIDDEKFSSGTNSFGPTCEPKEIDISITSGEGQGKVLQGIYEVEESVRRLCFQGGTGSRPDSFESFYGDESVVVTFVRE